MQSQCSGRGRCLWISVVAILTTEHGGAVHEAVDPSRGRVVSFKMSLKLHKEDRDAPGHTNNVMTVSNWCISQIDTDRVYQC